MVMKTVLLRQIEELYPGCEISIVSGNKYWSAQLMGGYRTLGSQSEVGHWSD